jgi:hypothetical protein
MKVVRVGNGRETETPTSWAEGEAIRRGPFLRGTALQAVGFGDYIIPENVSRDVPRSIAANESRQ